MRISEPAPAKLNLALHVRGKLPDGRHSIETIFAFCVDGDSLWAEPCDRFALSIGGEFGSSLKTSPTTSVEQAAAALAREAGVPMQCRIHLEKRLPVASGIGGGSADAAAALRLLTRLWNVDPACASRVAPVLGSDVPACLLSMTARGDGAGDALALVTDDRVPGTPVLLVNPLVPLSTGSVFAAWNGVDHGPLGDWHDGRNDLEQPATSLVPAISEILGCLSKQQGATFVRMSGSGATCFALFDGEQARDAAASACPDRWWHLATVLR